MISKSGAGYPGIMKFKREIEADKKAIRDAIQATLRAVARGVLYQLVHFSPVWTGSYVKSHRVGHRTKSSRGPTDLHTGIDGMWLIDHMGRKLKWVDKRLSPEEAQAAKDEAYNNENGEITRTSLQPFDKFILSNDIPYGESVEIRHSVYVRATSIGERIANEKLKVITLK